MTRFVFAAAVGLVLIGLVVTMGPAAAFNLVVHLGRVGFGWVHAQIAAHHITTKSITKGLAH
ncbi:MAG: hypothetical protein ACYCST_07215 [Acidimicrobiales bacterium]